MVTFVDGPAKGAELNLERAPTKSHEKVSGCNQIWCSTVNRYVKCVEVKPRQEGF